MQRGGEARDEMNMREDGVGRDKREVHRGARVPRKVKSAEHWVGRGSGK